MSDNGRIAEIITERDELREKLRHELSDTQYNARLKGLESDNARLCKTQDELRAEVERLKADKARLDYILIGTGITREVIDKQMKGDK